jgi:peptidoglycan/LPS O-acetylase OafA/YrhL
MTQPNKLSNVDALRGAAALMVAVMHVRQHTWIGMRAFLDGGYDPFGAASIVAFLLSPSTFGLAGVPIFFVISGYVIHRAHAERLVRDPSAQIDLGRYYWRRFVRIYPVLLAALIFTAMLDALVRVRGADGHGTDAPWVFLINLLSLQGIAGPVFGSNSPLWTLSIEVHFYLLYPVLFWAIARIGATWTFTGVAVVNVVSWLVAVPLGFVVFSSYWVAWCAGGSGPWSGDGCGAISACGDVAPSTGLGRLCGGIFSWLCCIANAGAVHGVPVVGIWGDGARVECHSC